MNPPVVQMHTPLSVKQTTGSLAPGRYWMAMCAALAVVISRSPDSLLHAQFWAEDGKIWYVNAYSMGWWQTLLRPQVGYIQVFPRLTAAMALLFPLERAPLVMNAIALLVQILPVGLLLSGRAKAWGGVGQRALYAAVYLLLPNCTELSGTVTNSQWLLALCALLIMTMGVTRDWRNRCFELAVLVFCGATGPFCLFLLPGAILLAWRYHQRWRVLRAACLGLCAMVQLGVLAREADAHRPHALLGASMNEFIHLLSGNVYLPALAGRYDAANWAGRGADAGLWLVALVCTALIIWCLLLARLEMKLLICVSVLIFASSLVSPTVFPPPGVSAWHLMATAGSIRYWFFPTLCFAWAIIWGVTTRRGWEQKLAIVFLVGLLVSIGQDWEHPPRADTGFSAAARVFRDAPVGTVSVLPLNPTGWTMTLVKH